MTSSELWRSTRFMVAVPVTIGGGLAASIGAWGVVTALLTGHEDPYHGGAMLLASGAGTLGFGVVLLVSGISLWPRRAPRSVRFLIAVPATLCGGLVALLGAWGVIGALRTGPQDPHHRGAMLASGAGTLGLGVMLLVGGMLLWSRRSLRNDHPREPAA